MARRLAQCDLTGLLTHDGRTILDTRWTQDSNGNVLGGWKSKATSTDVRIVRPLDINVMERRRKPHPVPAYDNRNPFLDYPRETANGLGTRTRVPHATSRFRAWRRG